ncbi:hypothetical protein [Azospirillum halopraeferens]|uniref:hypothetical protein n=1 Tax=Azospirillum halopraeferens TaxID=34010 RepID=UPI000403875E|nr:hypothetical protein [Azospirillum halopraeferens]
MTINSPRELEQAMAEYQRLAEAPATSQEGRRRMELDAEIKEYYVRCADTLKPGKPPATPAG